jgi:hypothetical protein
MLELLLAVWLVLLPFCAALFELAQLGVSRQVLQLALFEGVRAAAVNGADLDVLRGELARGLVPLFTTGLDTGSTRAAYLRASLEVRRPELLRITLHSPRLEDFVDFGIAVDRDRLIPNEGLSREAQRRDSGSRSPADANQLDVEVRYCRRLLMPVLDRLIVAALTPLAEPPDQLCLAQRRLPLVARAVTVMQSHASQQRAGAQR